MNNRVDREQYGLLMEAAASLSWLYSENDVAYIDSRLVERIFISASSSRDLARVDCSFDAIFNDLAGVGIKTFLGSIDPDKKSGTKLEKVAEFTRMAREGAFGNLRGKALATKVSSARNQRIASDANEYGISLDDSFYHCFVRTPIGGVVHEEPYSLIDVDKIRPTSRFGIEVDNWPKTLGNIYFSDGISQYSFNVSKNVLFKRFSYTAQSKPIPLSVDKNIFQKLPMLNGISVRSPDPHSGLAQRTSSVALTMSEQPGIDYVILPLYSLKGGNKHVPERSGINQWNARGRSRTFGEAYIPIPSQVHALCPNFFPARDTPFTLHLPTGTHSGKVCQDNSKALMTDPNRALGYWILRVLDPTMRASDYERSPNRPRPFDYDDLLAVGKDSVKVTKYRHNGIDSFSLEFANIGAFEEFIDDFNNDVELN